MICVRYYADQQENSRLSVNRVSKERSMKTTRLQILVTAFVIFIISLIGPVAADPEISGVVMRTLPNGLRLLVREQHSAPLVAVDASVRAGSGKEQAGESGAAHFLEHLIFKGTPTHKPGEIDAAIEELGATLAADTSRDAARFYTTVPSAHVATAVDVMADALRNSALDPNEVERERAVIQDELARGRNDTAKEAMNLLFAALAADNPYANPVLGKSDSIKWLPRAAIHAFYRRWYTPANTTVVIVGDITPDRAEELVKTAFGTWTGVSPQPSTTAVEPKSRKSLPEAAKPNTVMSGSSVGVPGGSQFTAVAFALDGESHMAEMATAQVVASLLGDGRTGRISSAMTEDALGRSSNPRPAASTNRATEAEEISGEYTPLMGPSLLVLTGQLPDGKADVFRKAIDAEIDRLKREPPSAADLDTARRHVIGPYLYDIETYGGQARALGMYALLSDYSAAQNYVDRLLALKPSDITAFARKWFTPEKRADLVLNPLSRP